MDEYLKEALGIVQAQARVRIMTSEEISAMVRNLAAMLRSVAEGGSAAVEPVTGEVGGFTVEEAGRAIKEKSIVCMECGKSFKILTKKHLASHGVSPAEYREKWGYKTRQPLVAKGLARTRRKKMSDMKLWERRTGAGTAKEEAEPATVE